MNSCIFIGRFTETPFLKSISKVDGGSTSVCNFTLAVPRKFKKANGELGKQTAYLDFEIYDSGAKLLCENFQKGDAILINASARNDNYTNADGKKIYRVRFRVESFEFLNFSRYENYENNGSNENSGKEEN